MEQSEYKYTPIMKNTSQEYDAVIAICRQLFINKMKDYGSAWRILRLPSLTDQIFIKAQRIRSLQENDIRKIDEDETGEYNGIIKYKIEKLSNTSLDNIILSVNPNMDRTEPEGFIRKIGSFDKLVNAINGDFRYSAGTFRNEYISDENYMQEQNLFIIDIDNDLTIEDAKALFSSITYLITTTKSHQKPKKTKINGESVEVVCDRFRIIIPTLSTFHLTPKVYSEMYMNVINSLGIAEADT